MNFIHHLLLTEYEPIRIDICGIQIWIDKIKNGYNDPFLGGQNHHAEFAEMARNVNGRLTQSTDYVIERTFQEEVAAFMYGEKNKAQALADFTQQVMGPLGVSQAALPVFRIPAGMYE